MALVKLAACSSWDSTGSLHASRVIRRSREELMAWGNGKRIFGQDFLHEGIEIGATNVSTKSTTFTPC